MDVRDFSMQGTFHTVVVAPPEKSFKEVKDDDNYWNRGCTAKYIRPVYGLKNATHPMVVGNMKASSFRYTDMDAPQPTNLRMDMRTTQPWTWLGRTIPDHVQPSHESVFD